MGAKSSKRNIVADTMMEDDSESYNLINIHTPTLNIGITVFCVLVGVVCLFSLYRYMVRAKCGRNQAGVRGRRLPTLPDTAAVDVDSHIRQTMPAVPQGAAIFGGDARNSYWMPKEDPCMTCLEDAWGHHGHRRARGRFGLSDLAGAGNPKSVYGGPGLEDSLPPRLRTRRPGGQEESPPPRKRTRARSVESF